VAGEVANIIAGNARKDFGSSFMISVPIIVKGTPEDILHRLRPPVFIIPILWRDYSAILGIGIETA
jgi:chemotaxis protein CheX